MRRKRVQTPRYPMHRHHRGFTLHPSRRLERIHPVFYLIFTDFRTLGTQLDLVGQMVQEEGLSRPVKASDRDNRHLLPGRRRRA